MYTYKDNTKLYKRLDRQASNIITKLQNKINTSGYYENLGQKELRQYTDKINGTDLTYQEKWQLTSMLRNSIDNL